MQWRRLAVHPLRPGLAVTALLMAAALLAQLVDNLVVEIPGVRDALDPQLEGNIPSAWNTVLLMLIALGAGLLAGAGRRGRPGWAMIGATAALMSVDEAAGIHENLGVVTRSVGLSTRSFAWIVPGVVIAGTGLLALGWATRGVERHARRQLAGAAAVYLTGAIAMEYVNGRVLRTTRRHSAAYDVGTVVEESLEMGACLWALQVVTRLVATRWEVTTPRADRWPGLARARIRHLVAGSLVLWASLVGAWLAVTRLAPHFDRHHPARAVLDPRTETSIPTWLQLALGVLAAVALGVLAGAARSRQREHALVAAVVAAIAVGEGVAVHERLSGVFPGGDDMPVSPWLILGGPVALAAAIVTLRAVRALPPALGRPVGAGVGVFLASAVVGEVVSSAVGRREGLWAATPWILAEETGEILGVALVAAAAVLAVAAVTRPGRAAEPSHDDPGSADPSRARRLR